MSLSQFVWSLAGKETQMLDEDVVQEGTVEEGAAQDVKVVEEPATIVSPAPPTAPASPTSFLGYFFAESPAPKPVEVSADENVAAEEPPGLFAFVSHLAGSDEEGEPVEQEEPVVPELRPSKLAVIADQLLSPPPAGPVYVAGKPKMDDLFERTKFDREDVEDLVDKIEGLEVRKRSLISDAEAKFQLMEAMSAMRKLSVVQAETNKQLGITSMAQEEKVGKFPSTAQTVLPVAEADAIAEPLRVEDPSGEVERTRPILENFENRMDDGRPKRALRNKSTRQANSDLPEQVAKRKPPPVRSIASPYRARHSLLPVATATSERLKSFPTSASVLHANRPLMSPSSRANVLGVSSVEARFVPRRN